VKRVQGRKVRHSNRINSATDCSISLKFCTKFIRSPSIHYTCSRSKVKVTGSGINVTT